MASLMAAGVQARARKLSSRAIQPRMFVLLAADAHETTTKLTKTLTYRSGEVLARVQSGSEAQLNTAIENATRAQREWRSVPMPVSASLHTHQATVHVQ